MFVTVITVMDLICFKIAIICGRAQGKRRLSYLDTRKSSSILMSVPVDLAIDRVRVVLVPWVTLIDKKIF